MVQHFKAVSQSHIYVEKPLFWIHGPNGSGKSSLCQALCVWMEGRVPMNPIREFIQWGKDYFLLEGESDLWGKRRVLGTEKGLSLWFNGKPFTQTAFHHHGRILFLDDERFFHFITRGSDRRKFLDRLAFYLYPDFEKDYKNFLSFLKMRNHALKKGFSKKYMETLTEEFIQKGIKISQTRFFIVEKLNTFLAKGEYFLHYPCYQKEDYIRLYARLERKERERGFSLFGPHREDMAFFWNGKPLTKYSLGQRKRALLWLWKQASFLVQPCLLVLDDGFIHLDRDGIADMVELLLQPPHPVVLSGFIEAWHDIHPLVQGFALRKEA